MNKTKIILSSICALAITNNSFSMKEDTKIEKKTSNQQPQDVTELLKENNKLLRQIKRQNRSIIKQNYLNFECQKLHTELCSKQSPSYLCAEKHKIEKKYQLQTKINEVYFTEKCDPSWSSSDKDDMSPF